MNIDKIYVIVCNYFDTDIAKKSRKRTIIYARSLCNTLCRKYTNYSLQKIGSYYLANHATVLHSLRKFDEYINYTDPFNVKDAYNDLCKRIDTIIDKKLEDTIRKSDNSYYLDLYEDYFKLKEKSNYLKYKLEVLEQENKKLKKLNRILSDFKELSFLNDSELKEFKETRLKPFVNMLESRKQQKQVIKVNGALLNRPVKNTFL